VREQVQNSISEIRFFDRVNLREFNETTFSEIVFRSGMLAKISGEKMKNSLISASFTAWQMLQMQGLEIGWQQYVSGLGLSETKPIDAETKTVIAKRSFAIADAIARSNKRMS